MINFTIKERSKLWVIFHPDGDKNINIVTAPKWKEIINQKLLSNLFSKPINWFQTSNGNYLYKIKNYDEYKADIQSFFDELNSFIWLDINKNIDKYFNSSILSYCVAKDLNFSMNENERTPLGKAEYCLKYKINKLSEEEILNNEKLLIDSILSCYNILPIDNNNICITIIPIDKDDNEESKLSYKMAKFLSSEKNHELLFFKCKKPKFKNLNLNDKIKAWDTIYSNKDDFTKIGECNIIGKDFIIVDDLYQSGVSMWYYAKFLKSIGANTVMGIAAVKSLRDSDNKNG